MNPFSTTPSYRLRARWVFPVDCPPIEDGVIEIDGGCIARLESGPDADAEDLGAVAIIPGLVNAHTHLEFSDLPRPVRPAAPFTDWIRAVIATRRQSSTLVSDSIGRGLRESCDFGTTLLGEIATDDASAVCFGADFPAGVVFRELIGIGEEAAAQQLAAARRHLAAEHSPETADVVRGLSPHAPYSVSAELLQETVELAAAFNSPVAMHLAETQEELELINRGTGPFVELLKDLGVWRNRFWMPEKSIQSYLDVLSHAPRALVVHGNYLTASELEFLAGHPRMAVVYCPRTHHYFRHSPHPWRTMLDLGVTVALGTDGRASNPDLSLWRELQFLRRTCADAPPQTLMELATIHGAETLGQAGQTGSLTPGKRADLAVVAFCDDALAAPSRDPVDRLLHPGNRVSATMRFGRWFGR